ncbi:MAG: transglycosylase SLT domain-containing protein [Chitinispirillaceae bacterium]|nr:transglycosylase SLT domain-containing protein [Chitinispirillaceae bacterium]
MVTQIGYSNSLSTEDSRATLIRKTAQEFGSLFVSMMIKEMRKGSFENDFMPQSFGQKLYTEMLDEKYAELISNTSLSSFCEQIVSELEKSDSPTGLSLLQSIHKSSNSQRFAEFATDTRPQADVSINYLSNKVRKWLPIVEKASKQYNVDINLIKAVIIKESAGNEYAVSRAGAKGLMQLMDATAQSLGVTNSFSPEENISGGVKYLAQMLSRFNSNESYALASYNAGPSTVEKYRGIPPYRETQEYVRDVLKYKEIFSKNEVE